MINLTNARDTFLKFLSDNLIGISVNPLRKSTSEIGTESFKINSVNIEFLGVSATLQHLASQTVVVSVIHEDEATAMIWIQSVYNVLSSAFYTPLLSYAIPEAPVAARGNLSWDSADVTFKSIPSGMIARYECVLDLNFIQ